MADTLINSYPTATAVSKFYAEDSTGALVRVAPTDYPTSTAPTVLYSGNSSGALVRVDATKYANCLVGAATGQIPYVNSSGAFTNLAAGTDGQVLTLASGIPSWATQAASSVSKISSQTVSTAVSQVTFTGYASTGYTYYILVVQNAVTNNAATSDLLAIHVSTDGGSTWKTTSGDYYGGASGVTAATRLCVFRVSGATSTLPYGAAEIVLHGLGNSSRATSGTVLFAYGARSVTDVGINGSSVPDIAVRTAAEADNAFRLIPTTGTTITAGTFTLYGVAS